MHLVGFFVLLFFLLFLLFLGNSSDLLGSGAVSEMESSSFSGSPTFVSRDELHVLAVDDCMIQRKFIERLLKNSAYKVTTVESGTMALKYLGLGDQQHGSSESNDPKINLIITDYCMPDMTGYELLKKIKESSKMKEIPVVIMSSENNPTRINKCLEKGAEEFIIKPLQQSDVKRLRCHMRFTESYNGRLCMGI